MEIDVNIEAHDLLWRSMSLRTKKAYRKSYGIARDELIDVEVQRLIEAGYVVSEPRAFNLVACPVYFASNL